MPTTYHLPHLPWRPPHPFSDFAGSSLWPRTDPIPCGAVDTLPVTVYHLARQKHGGISTIVRHQIRFKYNLRCTELVCSPPLSKVFRVPLTVQHSSGLCRVESQARLNDIPISCPTEITALLLVHVTKRGTFASQRFGCQYLCYSTEWNNFYVKSEDDLKSPGQR